MSKTISINLMSKKSINNSIQQLKNYRNRVNIKCEELVRRLSEIGISVIEENIDKAGFTVDGQGIESGANTEHYTYVKIHQYDSYTEAILTVEGEEILFIEFGAGVYYNGSTGSSPHPKGTKLGYKIGYYGAGYGKQKVWGYYDDSGALVLTHGVKATMPVYKAWQEIYNDVLDVAKEVFGND